MSLLGLDPGAFEAGRTDDRGPGPAEVGHQLRWHPLLTLDALGELADSLPEGYVEHHLNDLPDVLPGGRTAQLDGVGMGDLVRGVETNRCWVVLWNIEQSPRYAALLDECLAEITPHATPGERVVLREGFVFISAPNTVTPVHIDPEHNVLLQVVGQKTMTVGRFGADDGYRHREIERVVMGGHRWLPRSATDETSFDMTPGVGVYVPPFTPHRVRNGPGLCVSLSVTWRTSRYFRNELVYEINARMRRRGLSPRPPGESALRDLVKIGVLRGGGRTVGAMRQAVGRLHARPTKGA